MERRKDEAKRIEQEMKPDQVRRAAPVRQQRLRSIAL